jgi:membrane-associated phospholipid phosphatase
MSIRLEPSAEPPVQVSAKSGFHLQMACASAILLIGFFAGCKLTSVQIRDLGGISIALLAALAVVLPLPLYWQEKQRTALRDASLTIPWALFLAVVLPYFVDFAARLNFPLWDAYFVRLDRSLGISVPAITTWAGNHWLGVLANKSYPLLIPLLPIAFFAPALTGKVEQAQEFVISNLAAFAIGIPAFALLPAVGPWYGYHLKALPEQMYCQTELVALRLPGPHISQVAGIVCFPSFHVIWAIICVRSLWGFRPLRIPVALLSGLLILSTLTTGWHYFTDVLGGFAVAGLSIAIARASSNSRRRTYLVSMTKNDEFSPSNASPLVASPVSAEALSGKFESALTTSNVGVQLIRNAGGEMAQERMPDGTR